MGVGVYEFYSGDEDPRIHESEVKTREDVDNFNAVECSNGCGFWRGSMIENGQCPECGDECNDVEIDDDE